MDYLDVWREGHKDGIKLVIQEINKYCEAELETLSDLITYIQALQETDYV